MNIKHIILALVFCGAAAASIYVRKSEPVEISAGERLCQHALATGNVMLTRHCI